MLGRGSLRCAPSFKRRLPLIQVRVPIIDGRDTSDGPRHVIEDAVNNVRGNVQPAMPIAAVHRRAASCPWGLDAGGLPQAVQLAAAHFREDFVLRASALLEAKAPVVRPDHVLC